MKVKELIEILKKFEEDMEIRIKVEDDTYICINQEDIFLNKHAKFVQINAENW